MQKVFLWLHLVEKNQNQLDIAFAAPPVSRAARADHARQKTLALLNRQQHEFIDFVLKRYVQTGVDELDTDKLPALLELKYRTVADGVDCWGAASAQSAARSLIFRGICTKRRRKSYLRNDGSYLHF